MTKVLFVGDSTSPQYAKAFYEAGKKIENVDSYIFIPEAFWNSKSLLYKFDKHFRKGLFLRFLNRNLYKKCAEEKYDLIFFYGTSLIYANTIKKIKKLGLYYSTIPKSSFF